ncbi:MAG TPA: amidohydrolase family protein [Leptospiraceae bacterium]|nr:amidohydrolase family protein [Leptospirales bacterium]HMU82666.1 amidohydrolase family protein [Leptospiraceae bacterium]HMW60465.1 amidohydrolase family protein [Leptospiraceae bacterium]HMX55572.1 amidohydrolase family protein [Leptospiraceae bacterium]HNE22139.1 amidohydrolase family protein [Leptospiraceae bacterium]
MLWQLTNGTLLLPDGPRKLSGLLVSGGRIEEVLAPGDDQPDILTLNLHGALVIPGLINSHDTLMATYLPTKGENWPHLNWLSFDIETKRSALFRERMLLDVETLYRMGSLKNLESGVTAVVDHVPDFVRNPFLSSMSVEILPDFGIAHSVCSYSLGWGQGLEAEHKRAVENDLPFILHIAEGFDPESELSLRVLDRAGCLSEHTVLVHGLSLSNDDLDRIAEAGAHFVWCPSANLFAYNRTVKISEFLTRGIPVCLGTDAAVTGSTHMLSEIQTALKVYKDQTGEDLPDSDLFAMLTTNPARAFRWAGRGSLKPDSLADFVVLSCPSLREAKPEDIYLVVRGGQPVYGSEDLEPLFISAAVHVERVDIGGTRKIVQKGVKDLRETVRQATGRESFPFLSGW